MQTQQAAVKDVPPGTSRAHKRTSNDPVIGHAASSIPHSPTDEHNTPFATIQQAVIEILPHRTHILIRIRGVPSPEIT